LHKSIITRNPMLFYYKCEITTSVVGSQMIHFAQFVFLDEKLNKSCNTTKKLSITTQQDPQLV